MPTTWIISGDSSRARVLQVAGRHRLEEVRDFDNPKGRMNDRELTTDAHPRFRGAGGPGSDRQETGAAEHEVQMFAREIDRFLDQARKENRYDELLMIAPPKFLGLLRRNLNKEVGKLVREDAGRDLSWLDAQDLDRYLRNGRRPES